MSWRPGARRFVAARVLSAAALGAAGIVVLAAPAVGSEVHYPVASQFSFSGHGFGHGRGMSQWGAYGAATSGLNADQILSFYYPGTTTSPGGNPQVRVWIASDSNVHIDSPGGSGTSAAEITTERSGPVTVTVAGQTPPNPIQLPATVSGVPVVKWRGASTGAVFVLQGFWNGSWQLYPPSAPLITSSALTFTGAMGWTSLVLPDGSQRDYLGSLSAVPSGTTLRTVNTVDRESYLRTVVPSEMPSAWPAVALQAQAVAARTYEASVANPNASYDICDTTSCQVYSAWRSYDGTGALTRTATVASTDAALAATAGQIRTFGGAPIFAQFSSSDGGWTVDGGKPYLVAQADPYDGVVPNAGNSWSQTVSNRDLGARVGVGVATSLIVNARDGRGDWGGRVTSVTVTGTTGQRTLSGDAFRDAAGLKSTWWTLPVGSPPWAAFAQTDLFALNVSATRTGSVEMHVLTRASMYGTFVSHAVTPLPQIDPSQLDDWRFLVAPYAGSGSPDLFAIHLRGTASGRLEVHVLSAASQYQTWVAHIATGQPQLPAGQGVDVALASYGGDLAEDLFIIPWSNTGSGNVEVHVLSAASGYSGFLAHLATVLPTTGVDGTGWQFFVGDGTGAGDLVVVRTGGTTGSGLVELHRLSAASAYSEWTTHLALPQPLPAPGTADWGFGDFDGDGLGDLFLLLKTGSASARTEVHVLTGGSNYQSFALHLASPLPTLPGVAWQAGIG